MNKLGLYLFATFLLLIILGAFAVLFLPLFLWAHIQENPFTIALMALIVWRFIGRGVFRRLRAQDSPE